MVAGLPRLKRSARPKASSKTGSESTAEPFNVFRAKVSVSENRGTSFGGPYIIRESYF